MSPHVTYINNGFDDDGISWMDDTEGRAIVSFMAAKPTLQMDTDNTNVSTSITSM